LPAEKVSAPAVQKSFIQSRLGGIGRIKLGKKSFFGLSSPSKAGDCYCLASKVWKPYPNSELKKSLFGRPFKNSKCKEQSGTHFSCEICSCRKISTQVSAGEATQQLGEFQRSDNESKPDP
jgi:hypothetical protein